MLKNKIAIISGGSSGIGLSCVRMMLEKRCTVVSFSRNINSSDLKKLSDKFPNQLYLFECDISIHSQVKQTIKKVIGKFKRIDIVVNNAGIINDSFIQNMTDEQWLSVINVNLNGPFYLLREVIPFMIEQKDGNIVNISSIASERGTIGQSNYSASKSALNGLTRALSKELGKYGIRVNSVIPGIVQTDMISGVPSKILNKNIDMIPVNRIGTPDEIAQAVLFLASDAASYCSGCFLNVDGGLRI